MRYLKLGKTDILASVIGIGTWAIGGLWWGGETDVKKSIAAIRSAIENGINFIDTAPYYGEGLSEEIVGKAINGIRDKVVLATKCGLLWDRKAGEYFFTYNNNEVYKYLGKDSIKKEIELSLKRLKTDYIDLYITHWQDPTTPIEETLETLLKLKKEGKIRAIGASNTDTRLLKKYQESCGLDANQEKYNLLESQIESSNLSWCRENGITFLAYRPLGAGLLTGKIDPDIKFTEGDTRLESPLFSRENIIKINTFIENEIKPLSKKYNCTVTQVAISTLTSQDNIIALCGAISKEEVEENAKASKIILGDIEITNLKKAVADILN
jgi:methylglyoxal reductase